MNFYAHTKKDESGNLLGKEHWEPLFTPFGENQEIECQGKHGAYCAKCEAMDPQHGHLNKVAWWTARFAGKIKLKNHGYIAGLLHDFGKYSQQFQDYIDPNSSVLTGGDHSTAGAAIFRKKFHGSYFLSSYFISIIIACHHSGLIDLLCPNGENGYDCRFKNEEALLSVLSRYSRPFEEIGEQSIPTEINEWKTVFKKNNGTPFEAGLFTKFLFSCLIDADRTATVAFLEGKIIASPRKWGVFLQRFNNRCATHHKSDTELNQVRSCISDHCFRQATKPQGIYRLSLPTGSGKTLTSLRFALKHAEFHDLEQVVFVVPYTTILEQNAQEARDYLERNDFVVLEHHSNLSNEVREGKDNEDVDPYEKFSENWDAPVIFTTMVQFMNAFYQGGTKSVRRLHRLANSVIIFDEVQTLPLKLIHLFNRAANFLSEYSQSTLILCTATQPRIDQVSENENESLRLSDFPDLITSEDYTVSVFDRYEMINLGRLYAADLAVKLVLAAIADYHVLAVLNTKKSAKTLFRLVKEYVSRESIEVNMFFLSTDLCPQHRKKRIEELVSLSTYGSKQKVICISTNLIEAGVDLDFAQVFRASCPLDSLIQSAGRCNRHNKRSEKGKVSHFELIEESLEGSLEYIAKGAEITRSILRRFEGKPIVLSNTHKDDYFDQLYKNVSNKRLLNPLSYPVRIRATDDDNTMMSLLGWNTNSKKMEGTPHKAFCQSFNTGGMLFEVIPSGNISILVPYGKGEEFIDKIRNASTWDMGWSIIRDVQAYTISVYRSKFNELQKLDAIEVLNEEKGIYALHKSNYDDQNHTGLDPKQVSLLTV